MVQLFPAASNDDLFVIPRTSRLVALTDSVARKHLKKISNALHVTIPLTFHTFRRAGAKWAFRQGVPLEHFMKHGTWKSDAVWSYLSSSVSVSSLSGIATNFHMNPLLGK